MSSREDKTEPPTQKRKRDARKKGSTVKSVDLAGWMTLLVCTYAVPATIRATTKVVEGSLLAVGNIAKRPDPADAVPALGKALEGGFFAVMPILLLCLLVGTLTHFGQTGLVLTLHALKPDFKRINPFQGVKRLLSPKSVWETVKQLAKSIAIAWVARPHIVAISARLTEHGRVGLDQGLSESAAELTGMIRGVCWVVLGIAIVDYGYQRRSHIRDMRMTKQEVRDEMRQSEGDPQVKQRIRSMQMTLAASRMMADVGRATVVITNPTHIAIAIRYEAGRGGAPRIVAAGVGALAARIRERAVDARVPIVESKPLARALWRSCEVGEEIPLVLYEAVAKVLAFVRRLRGGVLAASPLPLPRQYDVERTLLDAVPTRRNKRRLI